MATPSPSPNDSTRFERNGSRTSSSIKPARGPQLQSLYLIAFAFAGLLAALLHFGVNQVPQLREVPPQTNAYSLINLESAHPANLPPEMEHWTESPTLFALPSLEGFSGAAWMRYSAPSLPLDVSTSEAHWISFSTNEIGATLAKLAEKDRPPDASVTDQQIPWRDNFPVDPPPSGRSILRREGPIAKRLMIEPEKIPTWTHSDVLLDTHVQVLVDAAGRTLTAALVDPPGTAGTRLQAPGARSIAAEQFALDYARRARYARTTPYLAMEPSPAAHRPDQLTWGYLIFRWHTIPPAATNNPTSASSNRL